MPYSEFCVYELIEPHNSWGLLDLPPVPQLPQPYNGRVY